MKLRTLIFCFAAAFVLTLCAGAADIVDSGKCGDNLTWTLDSDGVLTVSGNGTMTDTSGPRWNRDYRIKTAIINDGVTNIRWDAFGECENLTSVTIPDSVTSIDGYAFYGCDKLAGVTIPDGVTSIGESAFEGCKSLTNITIPDSVTSIGKCAFSDCSGLTSVTIPDSLTRIDECAFGDCSGLTSVTIPDSVTSIGSVAFAHCAGLTSVTIPGSVASIGYTAFAACANLTSVTISYGVVFLDDGAFMDCANLTSVTIPDSLTRIDEYAFNGCASLTDVYYSGSVTQWGEIEIGRYNCELKDATIRCNEKDVGIAIALVDENGKPVDPTKDVLGENEELTANFAAVDFDASSGLVTANVFLIFYDKDGLMVSLESKEIDLSDPFNLMFALDIRIPQGAKTMKILILGDHFEPLRAQRLIESTAA